MRLVLLGDPVAHSLSPAIQNAALSAASLPGSYEAIRVDADGMAGAIEDVRKGEIDGANVTMPHKRLAASLCDRRDPTANRAGAVNTLVRVGMEVVGHNTDVAGIRAAWGSSHLPRQGPVHLLGGGGAAAAALLALEGRDLTISTRRAGAGATLADALGVAAVEVEWGTPVPGAALVNATPIGMQGEALPEAMTAEATALFDMTYGPRVTPAVEALRNRSLRVADGAAMLLAQAAESFRLWTGRAADLGAMRAALGRVP